MLIFEIILAILLLIGIIAGLLLIFMHALPPQSVAPTKPVLTLVGQVLPGSKVTVHGKNFSPGSSVRFSLDNVPLAQTTLFADARSSYSTQMQTGDRASVDAAAGVIVRRDGTFDKTFTVPLKWKQGSVHSIEAYVQSKQTAVSVRLDFVVTAGAAASTPQPTAARSTPAVVTTPTPTHTAQPTPKVVPTPTPVPTSVPALAPTSTPVRVSCISVTPPQLSLRSVAGKEGNIGTVTINNCGDTGNWSSSVSTDNGGNWLWLSVGYGWLYGGASQRISLDSAALKAGTYTGWITFTSGANAVSVKVSLVVAAQPSCMPASTHAPSFAGDADSSTSPSQVVMHSSCGGAYL